MPKYLKHNEKLRDNVGGVKLPPKEPRPTEQPKGQGKPRETNDR